MLASEYWGCRDYFVSQIPILVYQNSWHIHVQIVLNALSGYYLNELGVGMLLSNLGQDLID
jgi:hypothetical protein